MCSCQNCLVAIADEPCGGNLTGSFGQIVSPNYPSNYPDDSDCGWTVTVEPGQVITFQIEFIDLEQCCGCDYIEIRYSETYSEIDNVIWNLSF